MYGMHQMCLFAFLLAFLFACLLEFQQTDRLEAGLSLWVVVTSWVP